MGSRVVLGGRTLVASRDWRPFRPGMLLRDRHGNLIETIPPESPRSPYRAGVPWLDPEEGITYRVVGRWVLDPRQGWATADFWLKRWRCDFATLREAVQRGFLDAALAQDSAHRRYRCRDESAVLAWLGAPSTVRARPVGASRVGVRRRP